MEVVPELQSNPWPYTNVSRELGASRSGSEVVIDGTAHRLGIGGGERLGGRFGGRCVWEGGVHIEEEKETGSTYSRRTAQRLTDRL